MSHCMHHTVYITLHTPQCIHHTVYTTYHTVYTLLYTPHCVNHTVWIGLYTLHCIHYIVYSTVYTSRYTLVNTVPYTLHCIKSHYRSEYMDVTVHTTLYTIKLYRRHILRRLSACEDHSRRKPAILASLVSKSKSKVALFARIHSMYIDLQI